MKITSSQAPVRDMLYTALFSAALCVAAPLSINIGPIPLSIGTLLIYLASATLDTKKGLMSVILYIMLGAMGLPVFSGFQGGMHKIIGPTGGFIIGYIPLAFITGVFAEISKGKVIVLIVGMVIATVILYTCGVLWFMLQSGTSSSTAIMICVTPFLIGDTIKITISAMITPKFKDIIKSF